MQTHFFKETVTASGVWGRGRGAGRVCGMSKSRFFQMNEQMNECIKKKKKSKPKLV